MTRTVEEGFNLYDNSGELEEYKEGYVVKSIDGRDDSIEFINGIKLYAGDIIGEVDEDQLRRIQIRETILSHIQRERQLFYKGIKVLSLFFIDEVAKYRQYDDVGNPTNGIYADMFEEEYENIVHNMQIQFGEEEYLKYLNSISAHDTHAGYFSIDKKGKMIDSKFKKAEAGSDDIDAYNLIMKNKELLLERNPKKSPVRFIFSHSALKEGWDNPNVFQICTLKQSSSDVRKRQEVGRGLRLCVNQDGERMDANALGGDVHNVNVLTVIASESYDKFAKDLQTELAENITDRPRKVNAELFMHKVVKNENGDEFAIDSDLAESIIFHMIRDGYVDSKGALTDKYYEDKANGEINVAPEAEDIKSAVIDIIDSIYDSSKLMPENARSNNVELKVDEEKLAMPQFKELWSRINSRTVYSVDFDSDELVEKAIAALDSKLHIAKIYYKVEGGEMDRIESNDQLRSGEAFQKNASDIYETSIGASTTIKYDLVGELVEETGLTRHDIVRILQGINPVTFGQFKDNPADFIIKTAAIINDEKATAIIQHITYNVLEDKYDMEEVFTQPSIRGKLGDNAVKVSKHLYDHLISDSGKERDFAAELDASSDVAVYVKLPGGFFISTPVGKYNPDWAIAFYEGNVKHIYFIAETKGSMRSMQLRLIEESKIHCAREHFKAISCDDVEYDVVDSYDALMEKVMK